MREIKESCNELGNVINQMENGISSKRNVVKTESMPTPSPPLTVLVLEFHLRQDDLGPLCAQRSPSIS
jgi:hypothetical protein